MKNKKTLTLTLIGLFIFLFSVIGITYAYWQLTLTQTSENLVYTDCLKITTTLGNGSFTLTDAYPMTNAELLSDFFPSQTPYHFTITNECEKEIPLSINMESLNVEENALKDEYVDVILWEDNETNVFEKNTDIVLSKEDSTTESKYQLTKNPKNEDKIITEAKQAYQLYKFKIGSKETKQFNLLLFMDYITPVSSTSDVTNNATWQGKITLNNYTPTLIETIQALPIQTNDSGNPGIYKVEHTGASITSSELRYAGPGYKSESTDYVHNYVDIDGQVWRIIGLVNVKTLSGSIEQRVKLVKSTSISDFSWDTSSSEVNLGHGVNEWSKSDLMKLLNPNYDSNQLETASGVTQNTLVNNSLYWNGREGKCYKDQSNATTSCNFNNDNNKMPESLKNMIESVTWNTGGNGSEYTYDSIKVDEFYNLERSSNTGKICNDGDYCNDGVNRTTSWTGKVGLIYPSDYGYATTGGTENTRTSCFDTVLGSWNNSKECAQNDWLCTGNSYWTLMPAAYTMPYSETSGDATEVFIILYDGYTSLNMAMHGTYAYVYPSVYLKEDVLVTEGDGSKNGPYKLGLKS